MLDSYTVRTGSHFERSNSDWTASSNPISQDRDTLTVSSELMRQLSSSLFSKRETLYPSIK